MVKTRWIAQIAFSTFAEELLQQREGKNQKLFPKASMQNEDVTLKLFPPPLNAAVDLQLLSSTRYGSGVIVARLQPAR